MRYDCKVVTIDRNASDQNLAGRIAEAIGDKIFRSWLYIDNDTIVILIEDNPGIGSLRKDLSSVAEELAISSLNGGGADESNIDG